MSEENPAPAAPVEIVRSELQVTNLIRGKQRTYGVPDNQFLRYSQYCNRRCAKIRSKLGIKGGKDFDLTPDRYQNPQHIELLVLQADGAWARYRDLKGSATAGQRRQHALRRLRKSLVWWNRANEAAKTFGTETTQLEVTAFYNYAQATLALELGHWSEALKKFIEVSATFKELGQSTGDSNLANHCHDITEDIEPLLVFCRYNLGDSENITASAEIKEKVKSIVSINAMSSTRKVSEVKWRNWTIPINHEGLKTKLASILDLIKDSQSEISNEEIRVTIFDRLIAESHGARQVIHTLSAQNTNDDLARLDLFLRWNSFVATLERSHALINTFNTAAERAEFAGRTFTRVVELRPQFEGDVTIESYEYLWHAIKCYYIGEAKSGSETITMLQRAQNHATKALDLITNESIEDPPTLKGWAERILHKIRVARIEAVAAINGLKKDQSNSVQRPFLEDQKSYSPCDTLVTVPPKAQFVTPKPMIFDLAGDYLQYPSLEGKLKKKGLVSKLKFW
ncbi:hypothetical protein TVAG_091590 [Trichomonas vaginalis G3]|uniref:Signal recognition particle subunit SRP68 n=2 Tax=Trichomonas vaginalis (strain ATCC PRA-98 / G3) TaxID=412133 RepID=A2FYP7_TRIV3|nr:endoplasmic reticulum signal peptide binding [Trichomonas vaginalis G3]EAX89969.1 hypothetical protein TVAG_091590 [Trichomonas vaginalis G3]KAI5547839.1 endoplasmic reticulum signal peptide binding [Trichomonas vaginalis G3]|eukprot:XP_001302899.1 hypothetical protein [Trichomonas vaginalis G3]